MLPWGSKKDGEAPGPDASAADEWAFLRSRTDFDAEEMSSVHASPQAKVRPAVMPQPPAPPVAPAARPAPPAAQSPGTTRTRPIFLSGPLPAGRIGRPVEVPAAVAWEGPLALEIELAGKRLRVAVDTEALVGRRDDHTQIYPQVDLTDDDAVSRRHGSIRRINDRYVFRDHNSLNGTRHNGRSIQSERDTWLQPGDVLELGDNTRLKVLPPGTEVRRQGEATAPEATGAPVPIAMLEPLAPGADLLDAALQIGEAAGLLAEVVRPVGEPEDSGFDLAPPRSEPVVHGTPCLKDFDFPEVERTVAPSEERISPAPAGPPVDLLDTALDLGASSGLMQEVPIPYGGETEQSAENAPVVPAAEPEEHSRIGTGAAVVDLLDAALQGGEAAGLLPDKDPTRDL